MREWIEREAKEIAAHAERELEALVAVSSPSGDRHGAEECAALCAAFAPDGAEVERVPCSSPDHAPDVVLRLRGQGERRVLLLGHVDTVVAADDHIPLIRAPERWTGSGTIDMKGGIALALGVLRSLAARSDAYAEVSLLLVCDEEWRRAPFAHAERFAGFDACLCFEAGEHAPDGSDAVIVRRKAAGTVRVEAHGRAAHAGASPHKGRNALLALARVAEQLRAAHDPEGPERLTAVPTVLRAGEAFNVVPAAGELICDIRALRLDAIEAVIAAVPAEIEEVAIAAERIRMWPGMDTIDATAPLLARASEALGRAIAAGGRGGASDASHVATAIPLTVDGLGPRGGHAHHPDEFVLPESLEPRAQVALAVAAAALDLAEMP
jgi:glutamate carboxypeptidase